MAAIIGNSGRSSAEIKDRLLTTNEFAGLSHHCERWVRDKCLNGEIKASKVGRKWIIPESELDRWLNINTEKATTETHSDIRITEATGTTESYLKTKELENVETVKLALESYRNRLNFWIYLYMPHHCVESFRIM